MSPAHARLRGFSLVEIALALGIIAFAIVGLIGLVAVSFDSGRASDEDTLVASMARQIVAELRAVPFDNLASSGVGGNQSQTYYFDHEAHRSSDPKGAIYQCVPIINANTDYNTPGTATANPKTNLYEIAMPFKRAAAPDRPAIQTIHASLARYD